MDERDRERYSRSRYGTGSQADSTYRSESEPSRSSGRYQDTFYRDMRIEDDAWENRPSSTSHPESEDGAYYPDDQYGEEAPRSFSAQDRPQTARRSFSRAAVERDIAEGASRASAGSTAVAKKRSGNKGLRIALIVLIAVVLVGAGAAFAFVRSVSSNLNSGVDQQLLDVLVETDMANEPFYILLLGTDGSAERDLDGELNGFYRSDSIILARIDAPNHKATLVSIPRDIEVNLGQYGLQKINAAYSYGGAALAVQAVSQLAGVPISHYAQVDFDGFSAIIDSLGGIEVNVPVDIDDDDAGGSLSAGVQTLTGDEALILCRSRNYGMGDSMRTANQRMVIGAMAQKALASDIGTIARTVQAASQYVTTDLSLNDIIGLAQAMRGLDPETDIYTASAPAVSQLVGDTWYDFMITDEWTEMMARVDAGLPPTAEAEVDTATGVVLSTTGDGTVSKADKFFTVTVKNASDISGVASNVRSKLLGANYKNVVIGDVNPNYSYPLTLVVYDNPDHEKEAQAILDLVGQGSLYLDQTGNYSMDGADYLVIIGEDWKA